jgi:hypothetical protein
VNEEAISDWGGSRAKNTQTIVLDVYLKHLNVLCYRTLTQYLQIHNTETMLNRRNCLWKLLYKICTLVDFYAALNFNNILTFRTTHWPHRQ